MKNTRRRWNNEQAYVGRISGLHGIPGQLDWNIVDSCKGVGMMLNKRDILLMAGTSILIVIATELMIWAITGYGVWTR